MLATKQTKALPYRLSAAINLGTARMQKPRLAAGLRVSTTLRSAFLLLPALLLIALLAFLPGFLLLLLLLSALLLATLLLATLLLLLFLVLILVLAHGVLSHRRVRDERSSRKRQAGMVRSSSLAVGTSSHSQELVRQIIQRVHEQWDAIFCFG
jgi:hypothetical protein